MEIIVQCISMAIWSSFSFFLHVQSSFFGGSVRLRCDLAAEGKYNGRGGELEHSLDFSRGGK